MNFCPSTIPASTASKVFLLPTNLKSHLRLQLRRSCHVLSPGSSCWGAALERFNLSDILMVRKFWSSQHETLRQHTTSSSKRRSDATGAFVWIAAMAWRVADILLRTHSLKDYLNVKSGAESDRGVQWRMWVRIIRFVWNYWGLMAVGFFPCVREKAIVRDKVGRAGEGKLAISTCFYHFLCHVGLKIGRCSLWQFPPGMCCI